MSPAVTPVVERSLTNHTAVLLLQWIKGILSQNFYQLTSLYKVKSQDKQFIFSDNLSLSQSQYAGTLTIFVYSVRVSLVSAKRFLVFKSSATHIALDLLLDAAVETENVSFGIRSLSKIFPTNGTLRFLTSLP